MASVTVSTTLELVRFLCLSLPVIAHAIDSLGVLAWCCPCVVYGQNKKRLEHLNNQGTPDPEHGGCFSGDCCIFTALAYCSLNWIVQVCFVYLTAVQRSIVPSYAQMSNRGSIRSRYNVKGSGLSDCCLSCVCIPCALTQEAQEIKLEEQSFGGYQKA